MKVYNLNFFRDQFKKHNHFLRKIYPSRQYTAGTQFSAQMQQ